MRVKKVKICLTCGKEFAFTSMTSKRQYCSRFCNPQRQKYNESSETIKYESAKKTYDFFKQNFIKTYSEGDKVEAKNIWSSKGHVKETICKGIISRITDYIIYIMQDNGRVEAVIINDIYTRHTELQKIGGKEKCQNAG